jgi:hypothetical protein
MRHDTARFGAGCVVGGAPLAQPVIPNKTAIVRETVRDTAELNIFTLHPAPEMLTIISERLALIYCYTGNHLLDVNARRHGSDARVPTRSSW